MLQSATLCLTLGPQKLPVKPLGLGLSVACALQWTALTVALQALLSGSLKFALIDVSIQGPSCKALTERSREFVLLSPPLRALLPGRPWTGAVLEIESALRCPV